MKISESFKYFFEDNNPLWGHWSSVTLQTSGDVSPEFHSQCSQLVVTYVHIPWLKRLTSCNMLTNFFAHSLFKAVVWGIDQGSLAQAWSPIKPYFCSPGGNMRHEADVVGVKVSCIIMTVYTSEEHYLWNVTSHIILTCHLFSTCMSMYLSIATAWIVLCQWSGRICAVF